MINLHYETKRLHLISLSKTDIEMLVRNGLSNYYKWFGDEDVTKYNSHGLFPKSNKELESYFNKCENSQELLVFLIIEKESKHHIGMVSLQRIDLINRSAEFAVIIGEKDYWGKGLATEAIKKVFEHGFNKLGLNRIWSGTSVLNKGMIKCFEKLGMVCEGRYAEAQLLNGKLEDIVPYAILRRNWNE